ncbi:MAG: hypothetical protein CMJ87_06120 [Planctomycetes bacterium]|nr:hypothetical protein [Planctomycetota bacterium]
MQTGQDTSLRSYLEGLMPDVLLAALAEGPGWLVHTDGAALTWEPDGEPEVVGEEVVLRWRHESGLRAAQRIVRMPAHRTATVQVTLAQQGTTVSLPLSAIQPLVLLWSDLELLSMRLRVLGGGVTHGSYPPAAYREREVVIRSHIGEPIIIESAPDGRSSNRDLPLLQLHANGSGLISALEWSGPWYQEVRPHPTGAALWAGVPGDGLVLAPGETLALPVVHLIGYEGDLTDGGNACRRYVYDVVCPGIGGQPSVPTLSYDSFFGVATDFDEAFLHRQVDRAAELGLEYFVVDAGWYDGCGPDGRGPFRLGVGNWEHIDTRKFPHGLESLATYVAAKGLALGLWFDIERAHVTSRWATEHPDWYLSVDEDFIHRQHVTGAVIEPGRTPVSSPGGTPVGGPGPDFKHLNLGVPAAQEGVIAVIGGWVERLHLKWIRWDYNFGPTPYWTAADPTGKVTFHHMEGLYRVLDTLVARYPDLVIEACAGGGRRVDLGTLRRAQAVWFSDHTVDRHICRAMQAGFARLLPGHLPNSAVPVGRGEGDGNVSDRDVLSRMVGALSFDGDIASWSPRLTRRVAELVGVYKQFRHLLTQDFYPLTPSPQRPEDGEAVAFVARDGSEAVVLAYRVPDGPPLPPLQLRGLRPGATFELRDPVAGNPGSRLNTGALADPGVSLEVPADGAMLRHLRLVDQAS